MKDFMNFLMFLGLIIYLCLITYLIIYFKNINIADWYTPFCVLSLLYGVHINDQYNN